MQHIYIYIYIYIYKRTLITKMRFSQFQNTTISFHKLVDEFKNE